MPPRRLESLNLDNTDVDDAGLVHLGGLSELKVLRLDNTHVTNTGLKSLRRLNQLRKLYVRNTKVSDVAITMMRETLPTIEVWTTPKAIEP